MMARKGHHLDLTRKDVADALDVSPPLISRYFGTQKALQDAVYYLAIDREIVEVVAQRIPPEGHLSPGLKKKVKKFVASHLNT
jgi:AcrR family transcriptional regulator